MNNETITWISISEELPELDKFVLFRYESGGMLWSHLDKDMTLDIINDFIQGTETTGPITDWAEINGPCLTSKPNPNQINLEL